MSGAAARLVCQLCGRQRPTFQLFLPRTSYRTAAAVIAKSEHDADLVGLVFGQQQHQQQLERRRGESRQPGLELVNTNRNPADSWTKMRTTNLMGTYLELSKARLTTLICATTVAGYMMNPAAMAILDNCIPFAAAIAGTALLSASASAYNQLLEAPYDAQMKRTQSRALVMHRISPLHAFVFANVTGVTGLTILWQYSNLLTLALGALNVVLYAGVYTPLKRHHIACTWAGAVVGAIPPLMGWAAASGALNSASLVLAGILYSWQFPHFNALSWNLRGDYSRAGYRVMCVTNERLCRTTTLRHSIALLGLCSIAAPVFDLTSLTFAVDSLPLNAYLIYLSFKFYRNPEAKTSRSLFRYSLAYLPLLMLLMLISNYGRNPSEKNNQSAIEFSAIDKKTG